MPCPLIDRLTCKAHSTLAGLSDDAQDSSVNAVVEEKLFSVFPSHNVFGARLIHKLDDTRLLLEQSSSFIAVTEPVQVPFYGCRYFLTGRQHFHVPLHFGAMIVKLFEHVFQDQVGSTKLDALGESPLNLKARPSLFFHIFANVLEQCPLEEFEILFLVVLLECFLLFFSHKLGTNVSHLRQVVFSVQLRGRVVAHLEHVVANVAILVEAPILVQGLPLLADQELFEVCFLYDVFFLLLSLKVLNFEVGETWGQDDETAGDGIQRHVDFFVLKTIFADDGHRNGPAWTLNRLVAVFFRRLPIFVVHGKVS